jgi:PKD repeat protein
MVRDAGYDPAPIAERGTRVMDRCADEMPWVRRTGATLLAAVAFAVVGCVIQASSARALLVEANGHVYGVTLVKGVRASQVPGALRVGRASLRADELPNGGSLLESHGGPVMHSATTHVIYWDPREEFTTTTEGIVEAFFSKVAEDGGQPTNVFAIAGQYTDSTGNAAYNYKAAPPLLDGDPYPSAGCSVPATGDQGPPYKNCIFDAQLQTELSAFITVHGLAKGPEQLYFVLLPHTVVTCYEGEQCSNNVFCAYHSVRNAGTGNEVIYADIPFSLLDTTNAKGCQADKNEAIQLPNHDGGGTDASTRFADVALKYISHEFIEAATDPVPPTGWLDSAAPEPLEIGDKCNAVPYTALEEGEPGVDLHAFTPTLGGEAAKGTLYNQEIHSAHYYLQSEWDNAAKACIMKPLPLTGPGFVHFPINPLEGETVAFTGGITDPYHHPEFTWKFGDATQGSGQTPTHVYAHEGTYKVLYSVKDALTDSTVAPVEQTITVEEPPTASFTAEQTAQKEWKFNASASEDKDGTIEKYTWEFGDGTVQEGKEVTHKYENPNLYPVTLTVEDSTKITAKSTREVRVIDAPRAGRTAPNSSFVAKAAANTRSGAITVSVSVANPGTLGWLATFANGKFGVFASSISKCKKGTIKLARRCRPATIVYAKGSASVAAAGSASVTFKPTASARKALANARKHHAGLVVTLKLTFQSSLGGTPTSSSVTLTIKLKK